MVYLLTAASCSLPPPPKHQKIKHCPAPATRINKTHKQLIKYKVPLHIPNSPIPFHFEQNFNASTILKALKDVSEIKL